MQAQGQGIRAWLPLEAPTLQRLGQERAQPSTADTARAEVSDNDEEEDTGGDEAAAASRISMMGQAKEEIRV